jgi:peptidoglycan-N-acetylglucosamine deacetylase
VKATFFVKGTLARQRPDSIRSIIQAGHTVANHSDNHPSATFWCLPPASIAAEIDRCNQTLAELTGRTPIWFRAPVGMKNPAVHAELARRRMRLIGWSVRGFDTVTDDPAKVASRIVSRVHPGATVVLHQGRAGSPACIARVIDDLRERGYSFVIPADDRLKTNK